MNKIIKREKATKAEVNVNTTIYNLLFVGNE